MSKPSLPTVITKRYVKYIVGFGVAVAVGIAPFLGNMQIPFFKALLEIFPEESKTLLISVSAILAGIAAVVIQYYSIAKIARKKLDRRFVAGLICLLADILILVVLYTLYVVEVPTRGGNKMVFTGWSRLPSCKCGPEVVDCIDGLAFNLTSCWSASSIAQVKISMYLSYLLLISGFPAWIGILILREQTRRQQNGQKRKTAAKKTVVKQSTQRRSTRRATKPAEPPPSESTVATRDAGAEKPRRGGRIKPGAPAPGTGAKKSKKPQGGDTHDGSAG